MAAELAGRVAVVAGGARGIGAGIAAELTRAHARVVVADIEDETAELTAERLRKSGAAAEAVHLDATHPHDWHALAHHLHGELDMLVYSIGIFPRGDLQSCEPEAWERVLAVNCTGFYLACRELFPLLRERGGGAAVAIGSVMAHRPNPGMLAYSVSKAGLAMLVRSLARGCAKDKIRVNLVNPGWVDTPGERMQRVDEPDWQHRAAQLVPLGRLQTPEELGALCAYLCSEAGASITGQCIGVDGGLGV